MWNADQPVPRARCVRILRQGGAAAVEFALLVLVFLPLVFGILEIARMIYLFNTLQEVSRRAAMIAANSGFDQAAQDALRRQAMFRDGEGKLALGRPITFQHLRVEYLSLARDGTGPLALLPVNPLPANPEANRLNCVSNPYGANCIRYVRVQICQPGAGADCDRVPYEALFPLIDLSMFGLPRAQTIVPAQSMGFQPGAAAL